MRKEMYFVGIVVVTAAIGIISSVFLKKESKGTYAPELFSAKEGEKGQKADDALEWLKGRYIDVQTGQPVTQEKLAEIRKKVSQLDRSKNIAFTEEGPDNIGGRTRAIQVDRTNINRVWAGGVSGGLFVSLNKGNVWNRVESYFAAGANPYISSMTQTTDGTFFVATGSNQEGWGGNGVW
ncbi:MAG: hypothetical protein EB023_13715, partial [Flavobacteriia bacterium]|nr:hypothetical protein [Flavobacteriia bacterium]